MSIFDFSIFRDKAEPEWRCLQLSPGWTVDIRLECYVWSVLEEMTAELICTLEELVQCALAAYPEQEPENALWLYALDHARGLAEAGNPKVLLH